MYGKEKFYSEKLFKLPKQLHSLYPGWLMRVYFNQSIDESIICEIECQKINDNKDSVLINNVDFCNVSEIKIKYENRTLDPNSYMLPVAWRWLPIGDVFVDVFSSRDTDSFIFQREVDSVNVWLESNKFGHIMRDHPWHLTYILAGMWGLNVNRNRTLANLIFQKFTNPGVMAKFNPDNTGKKGISKNIGNFESNILHYTVLYYSSNTKN